MKWSKLIADPSSGDPSMSRLCFGMLIMAIILVALGMACGLRLKEAGTLLTGALGITAGLYGANSVAGAWNRSKALNGEKPPDPSPGPVG